MEQKNRRGFFTFIGQCIAAAFVAPAVLPKVAEAVGQTTELSGIDLSGYIRPVDFDSLPFVPLPDSGELGFSKFNQWNIEELPQWGDYTDIDGVSRECVKRCKDMGLMNKRIHGLKIESSEICEDGSLKVWLSKE